MPVSLSKTTERLSDQVEDRFKRFVGLLSTLHNVDLEVPSLDPAHLKEFCGGLIEGRCHPWRDAISRLSQDSRWSISLSLFLFRKVIPSEKPHVDDYVSRMCQPTEVPSPELVRFAVRLTSKLFPPGWDKSYLDYSATSTLPTSSCFESGRKSGGCRGLLAQERWLRSDFCEYVTESVAPRHRGFSRVQAVEAGGKWRIISIPPRVDNALRPLHKCMYDKLSKESWLLRGDASANRFKGFHFVPDEVFVSGDYESATDNLNSLLQTAIFHTLLGNARRIPDGIRSHALSIFESLLKGDSVRGFQGRGQLMGQLTSFPLLCLTNYIMFKFSVPRDVPVKINGDDIVFRSTREESESWFKNVGRSGLKVSMGKTLVHSRFFTLNSTLFKGCAGSVRGVPFIRPRCIWTTKERGCERVASMPARFKAVAPGYGKRKRVIINTFFLNENRSTVNLCRRSLTRGMGMSVGGESLVGANLWWREIFYLEKDSEPELPRFSFSDMKCKDLPSGWYQVSRLSVPESVRRGWEARLAHEMIKSSWESDMLTDSDAEERWMEACHKGTDRYGDASLCTSRLARLAGLSRGDLWRYLFHSRNVSVFGRRRFTLGKGVYRPGHAHPERASQSLSGTTCIPPPSCLGGEGTWSHHFPAAPDNSQSLVLWAPVKQMRPRCADRVPLGTISFVTSRA